MKLSKLSFGTIYVNHNKLNKTQNAKFEMINHSLKNKTNLKSKYFDINKGFFNENSNFIHLKELQTKIKSSNAKEKIISAILKDNNIPHDIIPKGKIKIIDNYNFLA